MKNDASGPMDAFGTWPLRRVARAVEAGEVPASLLMKLQANFEAALTTPQEKSHAAAVQQFAEIAEIPPEQAEEVLETREVQPTVSWLLMRRVAKEWLKGQHRTHRGRRRTDSP